MRINFHADAAAELEAAAEWYERERPGLGRDFLEEVEHGLDAIVATPLAWSTVPDLRPARRFVLSRFPYSLAYVPDADEVRILAVVHLKRRPGYWRTRMG